MTYYEKKFPAWPTMKFFLNKSVKAWPTKKISGMAYYDRKFQ